MPETSSTIDRARELQNEIVQWRRNLHSMPELSFQEFETANFIAAQLEQLGYKVRRNVAKTGLVADIGSGQPTIAVRAEMDGLPIAEMNRLEYASRTHGVSHACGHDVNIACALGAAKILSQSDLQGRVRIIMQPAAEDSCDENGKTGAMRMIDEGAIDEVAAIIAMHVDATMPAGIVGIIADPFVVAPNQFAVRIESATDANSFNAVAAAAEAVHAMHGSKQNEHILISSMQATSPDLEEPARTAVLQGSFKSFSKEMRKSIVEQLENALSNVKSLGGTYRIEFAHGGTQLPRHQEVVDTMHDCARDLIGGERVKLISRKTWTEDFSGFTRHLPGSLMLLGGEIASNRRTHHSPTFDVDESSLHIGSAILAATVQRLFAVFATE
jgi:amidohydrolase